MRPPEFPLRLPPRLRPACCLGCSLNPAPRADQTVVCRPRPFIHDPPPPLPRRDLALGRKKAPHRLCGRFSRISMKLPRIPLRRQKLPKVVGKVV